MTIIFFGIPLFFQNLCLNMRVMMRVFIVCFKMFVYVSWLLKKESDFQKVVPLLDQKSNFEKTNNN
jgi:hypothetical protein